MSERFAGQVALVTGAASGIGRATAVLLARQGAAVVAADLDAEGAAAAVLEIVSAGGVAVAQRLDVTSEADWEDAVGIVEKVGRLGVLVNSAGIALVKSLGDTTLDEWRRVHAVNLDGVFLGTRAAVRMMRPTGGGSIVNVASVSGLKATPAASAYCSSKAAVILFTKATAVECAADGGRIRVNAVAPAGVKTPLWAATPGAEAVIGTDVWTAPPDAPIGKRFATAEEVAAAIAFLASAEASYVTGSVLVVDAGYTA